MSLVLTASFPSGISHVTSSKILFQDTMYKYKPYNILNVYMKNSYQFSSSRNVSRKIERIIQYQQKLFVINVCLLSKNGL